jgi:hypothetical protein
MLTYHREGYNLDRASLGYCVSFNEVSHMFESIRASTAAEVMLTRTTHCPTRVLQTGIQASIFDLALLPSLRLLILLALLALLHSLSSLTLIAFLALLALLAPLTPRLRIYQALQLLVWHANRIEVRAQVSIGHALAGTWHWLSIRIIEGLA